MSQENREAPLTLEVQEGFPELKAEGEIGICLVKREGKTVSSRESGLEKRGTNERSLPRWVLERRGSGRVVVKGQEVRLDKTGSGGALRQQRE